MTNRKYVFIGTLIFAAACLFASESTDGKSIDIDRTEQKIINSIGMEFVYVPPGTFFKRKPPERTRPKE